MTTMHSQQHALSLLDRLYDGVANAEKWPSAIAQLGAALGGCSIAVITHHVMTDQLSVTDAGTLPDGLLHDFATHNDIDPARAAAPMLAAGHIYVDHDFHGAANLRRMPFYQDFLRQYHIGHYALLPAGSDAQHTHVLSVLRESARSVFDVAEQRLMQTVQPHLRHALNLRQQLGQQQARLRMLERTFDTLHMPLLACSMGGNLAMANAAGRTWAAQADCPLGQTTPSPAFSHLLERACGLDTDTPSAGALTRPDGDVVVVLPLAPIEAVGRNHALALIAVQGPRWRPQAPDDILRTLFRLTPAECRLLQRLAQHDEPLTVAAVQMGLSLNTLRTQLKAIFQKTHTQRQTDLLRLTWQLGIFTPSTAAVRS